MLIARIRKLLPLGLLLAVSSTAGAAQTTTTSSSTKRSPHSHSAASKTSTSAAHKARNRRRPAIHHVRSVRKPRSAKSIARSKKLQRAFVASSQLRPMAQQLAALRTPQAYSGVSAYARAHSGEAASAAYLALGHAYLLDRRYPEAIENLQKARAEGQTLDDYADYLAAQAELQSGKLADAQERLNGFAGKYPESIFVEGLPVTIANLSLGLGDPQAALRILRAHASDAIAGHADYQFALARANQLAGNTAESAKIYRRIFLTFPLHSEAQTAKEQLAVIGAAAPLTIEERKTHADALYAGGRYAEAADEYRSLAADRSDTDVHLKNELLAAAAACDFKMKRLNQKEVEALPDTQDETGARRLYLLMELARNKDDGDKQRSIVEQMERRFPSSPWLAEALYSSGNMYLLRKDYSHAVEYYEDLAKLFPKHRYSASSQWKAAWLNYRLGDYSTAAKLMDVQIAQYPGGKEIPAALYWRGRLYEEQEHRPDVAAAYYQTVATAFEHYYYAQVARERLTSLGSTAPADIAMLKKIQPEEIPALTDDVPEDDEHVVKAHLLANAGLNEYIPAEIQAADGSEEWGAFAQAEIYASYGEAFRAMEVLKRAIPFYASAPINAIPMGYWKILFPQPHWETIEEAATKNRLDPYMVASLIRQESEFNAGAVSRSNAFGLMQLLPSVGRSMAKEEGIRHFSQAELLDADTNIRLGTRYLSEMLSKFGGQPEYAFAAYNAGMDRVTDWQTAGKYSGIDEFVESIPFTETREYVQAILRNESIYRELNRRAANEHEGVARSTSAAVPQ
jgi:soluble lytic murein transglycosylase